MKAGGGCRAKAGSAVWERMLKRARRPVPAGSCQNRSPQNHRKLEGAPRWTDEETKAQMCSRPGCCNLFSGSSGDLC